MTTPTFAAGQLRNTIFLRNLGDPASVHAKAPSADKPSGSLIIEKKPIFRSGSFADSMGREHEWEALHVNQMVDHFELLSTRGNFDDVPIRKGHPDMGGLFGGESRNRMDELVGYITAVYAEERTNPVDGQLYTYLLADLEIIEETAKKNVESGLWRNMSAEIGSQITNGRAEYWPCICGVAYVDQPAVEGLKNHAKPDSNFSLITEDQMTAPTPPNPQPPVPGKTVEFSLAGKPTADYAAVQAHISRIEQENADLRNYRKESEEHARVNYVNGLVKDNKILAPQADGYIAYAKSLDADAFGAWKKLMDDASPHPVTGQQGSGFSASAQQVTDTDENADRIGVLKGIVANHQLNQMPVEQIKATGSYRDLIALEPTFQL